MLSAAAAAWTSWESSLPVLSTRPTWITDIVFSFRRIETRKQSVFGPDCSKPTIVYHEILTIAEVFDGTLSRITVGRVTQMVELIRPTPRSRRYSLYKFHKRCRSLLPNFLE